ncbi:SVSP family protein [Theileria parva strain Muguga]|uniref:SVSP family protein n=1 Tax=Theileria parva strain Muguga TaxID=333668 RepID=UPI001C619661|nr:SVSP family protein [Theileria parva strain Muguga]EAN33240.2 SVSP family protein [Theileria parva strain Muguga]
MDICILFRFIIISFLIQFVRCADKPGGYGDPDTEGEEDDDNNFDVRVKELEDLLEEQDNFDSIQSNLESIIEDDDQQGGASQQTSFQPTPQSTTASTPTEYGPQPIPAQHYVPRPQIYPQYPPVGIPPIPQQYPGVYYYRPGLPGQVIPPPILPPVAYPQVVEPQRGTIPRPPIGYFTGYHPISHPYLQPRYPGPTAPQPQVYQPRQQRYPGPTGPQPQVYQPRQPRYPGPTGPQPQVYQPRQPRHPQFPVPRAQFRPQYPGFPRYQPPGQTGEDETQGDKMLKKDAHELIIPELPETYFYGLDDRDNFIIMNRDHFEVISQTEETIEMKVLVNLIEIVYRGKSIWKCKSGDEAPTLMIFNRKYAVLYIHNERQIVSYVFLGRKWTRKEFDIPQDFLLFKVDDTGKEVQLTKEEYCFEIDKNKLIKMIIKDGVKCTKIMRSGLLIWEYSGGDNYPTAIKIIDLRRMFVYFNGYVHLYKLDCGEWSLSCIKDK